MTRSEVMPSLEVDPSPMVGVVMAAHNTGLFIEVALRSLMQQSYQQWHCVVVDDGSTDDTAAVVGRLAAAEPRVTLVQQANTGISGARNAGLTAMPVAPTFLHFLDSDDWLAQDALAVLVAAALARPDAVGVYGLAELADEAGEALMPGFHVSRQQDRRRTRGWRTEPLATDADSTFADLVMYNPVWPAAVGLHRRSIVEAAGRFDSSLSEQEDWDLFLRMSRSGPFAPVPEIVAHYRRHGSNLTGNALRNHLSRERVIRRAFRDPENTRTHRALLVRASRRLRLANAKVGTSALRGAVATRRWATAGRAVLGIGWTLLTVIPSRPPAPQARRIAWVRSLDSSSHWVGAS